MSMWCRFTGSVVMTTGLSLHSPHGGRARRRRCRFTRVPGTGTKVHRRRGSNGEQDWMSGGGPGLPEGGGRRWELTLIWSPTDETQRRARADPPAAPAADMESRSPPAGQTPEGVSRWSAGDSDDHRVAVEGHRWRQLTCRQEHRRLMRISIDRGAEPQAVRVISAPFVPDRPGRPGQAFVVL